MQRFNGTLRTRSTTVNAPPWYPDWRKGIRSGGCLFRLETTGTLATRLRDSEYGGSAHGHESPSVPGFWGTVSLRRCPSF